MLIGGSWLVAAKRFRPAPILSGRRDVQYEYNADIPNSTTTPYGYNCSVTDSGSASNTRLRIRGVGFDERRGKLNPNLRALGRIERDRATETLGAPFDEPQSKPAAMFEIRFLCVF